MPCVKPLVAYKHLNSLTKYDKNRIFIVGTKNEDTFKENEEYLQIELPCGQCTGCRIDRSRSWALRCVHEASLYDNNCFITLTFDDEHLNKRGTLVKSDFQKFMKRLRKLYNGCQKVTDDKGRSSYPIRYFHCGEYGSEMQRPHHHACLFNYDFSDKVLWSVRDGVKLYRSAQLEELWPYGFSTVGDLTFESAAYVARYCQKKITGADGCEHYVRYDEANGELYYLEPEYATMSRRPGIARQWFEMYHKTDVYNKDFITHEGAKFRTPAYYDKVFADYDKMSMDLVKERRLKNAKKLKSDNVVSRLLQKEKVLNAKSKMLKRGLEKGKQYGSEAI